MLQRATKIKGERGVSSRLLSYILDPIFMGFIFILIYYAVYQVVFTKIRRPQKINLRAYVHSYLPTYVKGGDQK